MSRRGWAENLRFISEYVYYSDAPGLLGIRRGDLTKIIRGRVKPSAVFVKRVARVAEKIRRRESQLKRYAKAEAERHARREIRQTLIALGRPDLVIPKYLLPFLRYHSHGQLGSPVYIYDFRHITPDSLMKFFRFMKTVAPSGSFFLTYEVKPGGTSPGGAKNYRADRVEILSTRYYQFCVNLSGMAGDTCAVLTDLEFFDIYDRIHSYSAKRRVIECGISYPRTVQLNYF